MPKVDAVAELAGMLLRTLQEMRTEGTGYPPTLGKLSARADPAASAEQIGKALAKKPFAIQILTAAKKNLETPVALAEDLDLLARGPALLEFALSQLCSPEKPLVPLAKVIGVVDKALRPAFQTALDQHLRDNTLPAVAGSLTVKGKLNLFLKRYPPPLSPAGELAGRLLECLRKRKAQGAGYPATLDELKQEVEPDVKAPLLKQALGQDQFVQKVLRPVPTRIDAPVVLVEDRDLLAGSSNLLEYLLTGTTTARKPLTTLGHLKLHLVRDLQQPFEDALARQIAENRLPATVGMLRRGDQAELYLDSRASAAWVLGQKMLITLQERQKAAANGEPASLEQLAGGASPELIKKALADKSLKTEILIAIPGQPASPVVPTADRDALAGSPVLLVRLLQLDHSAETQAFALADLSKQLDRTLRYTFETTLEQQLETKRLPAGIGCVKIRKVPYFFLLADLGGAEGSVLSTQYSVLSTPEPAAATPPAKPELAPEEFERRFAEVFDRMDRQRGGVNLVSLVGLRRELGIERTLFDHELQRLRRAGRYTMSAAEGRHGLTEEDRQAGLIEGGTLLLFVSRRQE